MLDVEFIVSIIYCYLFNIIISPFLFGSSCDCPCSISCPSSDSGGEGKSKRAGKNGAKKNKEHAPVVQTLDSAIHRINHYPADSVIDLRNTYPLDSDLSGG